MIILMLKTKYKTLNVEIFLNYIPSMLIDKLII